MYKEFLPYIKIECIAIEFCYEVIKSVLLKNVKTFVTKPNFKSLILQTKINSHL
jgi:hypothetical protein